ncbi:hypothetical protein H7X87_03750 [Acetobacteraceae bacterium]|nr:hypothetical protein [Candidatus Parcubacteria bacterium]
MLGTPTLCPKINITSDSFIQIFVSVVGVIGSLGYYPQAWRIFKNKSAHDVSLSTYAIFAFVTTTWLLYGFYENSWVIISSFALGVAGSWLVTILTLYYRRQKGL